MTTSFVSSMRAPIDLRSLADRREERRVAHRLGGPWSSDQVVRLVFGNAIGVALASVAWYQLSGETAVNDQIGWLNLGLAGIGVAGMSNAQWLLGGRREVGRVRRLLLPDIVARQREATAGTDLSAGHLVSAPGQTRYHLPSCPFVTGRNATEVSSATRHSRDLLPCEICLPDESSSS